MRFSTLQIAWRNLGRHRRRTALTVAAIAIGQLALLATTGLMHGYTDNIRQAITGPMIGHIQIHAPDWREERALDLTIDHVDDVIRDLSKDPDVASAAARIYSAVLAAPANEGFTAMVVGVDIAQESNDFGLLSGLDEALPSGKVLVGYRLARRMKIAAGAELALVGQGIDGSIANDLYVVHDIIKCPADMVNQSGVVMSLSDAQKLFAMEGQAHEIMIRVKEQGQTSAVTARLRKAAGFEQLEVMPWQELVPELLMILETADYMAYFILGLISIAAIAGIANTLMMSAFERMHEFGMLLALGSRPRRLVAMMLIEAACIGIVGVIVGTLLGYVFVWFFHSSGIDMAAWGGGGQAEEMAFKGLKLPLLVYPRIEIIDAVQGLIAVILTSLLAAVWPASIAAKLDPMEAMRS